MHSHSVPDNSTSMTCDLWIAMSGSTMMAAESAESHF